MTSSNSLSTLSGYAIPLAISSSFDHTYVVSSCGLRWGCYGRDNGGVQIGSAHGSSVIADCLAGSNGEAGIRYAITGVCHQMSNRILYPAQVTVERANGYGLSVMMYGKYGRGDWKELPICDHKTSTKGSGYLLGEADMKTHRFSSADDESSMTGDDLQARADFLNLIERRLPELDAAQVDDLLSVQQRMRIKEVQAANLLDERALSDSEYLICMREIFAEAVSLSSTVLNQDQMNRLFEAAARNPETLIDEAAFFRSRQP